jgi:magnesium chelatase family protein
MVDVETQVLRGLKRFALVGLPDGVVREAKDRVRCAIQNSGLRFPHDELIVSLAPASLPKLGARFDLAIALSILAADKQISKSRFTSTIFLGELALDGSIKPVTGVLAVADAVRRSRNITLVLPYENAADLSGLSGVRMVAVKNLLEVIAWLEGRHTPLPPPSPEQKASSNELTFGDVCGQDTAKRALEIAAAGGHNVLMVGPPGSGKSMLARRVISILPPLEEEEALEVNKIYSATSVLGQRSRTSRWLVDRPFRSPHHTTSAAALIGGGSIPQPGEISLAHRGVLFLDELPELRRDSVESLREPLEARCVSISRAKLHVTFPSDFMLVAAMNPCPCGKHSAHPVRNTALHCSCAPHALQRYRNRLSGPILDRIDLHVWVPAVPYRSLQGDAAPDPTASMALRVKSARQIQGARLGAARVNASMNAREVRQHCKTELTVSSLLEKAAERFGLSARTYTNVLKVARTIADIEASNSLSENHVMEALTYRSMQT